MDWMVKYRSTLRKARFFLDNKHIIDFDIPVMICYSQNVGRAAL
jgi:hypothetical protein